MRSRGKSRTLPTASTQRETRHDAAARKDHRGTSSRIAPSVLKMFAVIDNFIAKHALERFPWYLTARVQTITLGIVFFWGK